jgi:hypothetical protein
MLDTKVMRVVRRADGLWEIYLASRSGVDCSWQEETSPILAQRVCFATGGRQEVPMKVRIAYTEENIQ